MDPVTTIAAASGGLKILKDLRDLARDAKRPELLEKLNDLQLEYGQLIGQLHEREERIRAQASEIAALRDAGEFVFREDVLWRPDGEGPYCPKCRHADPPKAVRMGEHGGRWYCAVCEVMVITPRRRAEEKAAMESQRSGRSNWLDRSDRY